MNEAIFRARDKASLTKLKRLSDLDEVHVDAGYFKKHGLLLHAVKYAFWAVKPGGLIVVADEGSQAQGVEPWRVSFPAVRQVVLAAVGEQCDREESVEDALQIRLRRRAAVADPGWSAGVIFSGNDAEVPTLARCLDGLSSQDELVEPGGEVVVCGPKRGLDFLKPWPQVRYLEFEGPPVKPFPISVKKNFLINHLRGPRVIVLHARIVLDAGVLGRAPREFDFLSPNVFLEGSGKRTPNVCYSVIDPRAPHLVPHRFALTTRHVPARRYLDMLRHGRPYIDGGAFVAMKDAYARCSLNEALRWADMEDVEWCRRAEAMGLLCDLDPDVTAISQTSKVRPMGKLPPIMFRFLQNAQRILLGTRNFLRFHLG